MSQFERVNEKIQLTEEENNILVDICKTIRLSHVMVYFHLLSERIIIKFINLSDEQKTILLKLLKRLPAGYNLDGDAVILNLDDSRKRASLMYATTIVAEYTKED